MLKTLDGKLVVIAGASRSGKTAYTLQAIKDHKRVIAWDPEDQFSQSKGFKRVTSPKALIAALSSPDDAKIAYVCGANLRDNFNLMCACAFRWGWKFAPCTVVAEELADVTNTAKATEKWGILLRRGLKRGINIYAISQRWAEADKTAIGNASEFVCFRMNGDDIPYMAKKTRIPIERLEALNTLEYMRYVPATKVLNQSKVKF